MSILRKLLAMAVFWEFIAYAANSPAFPHSWTVLMMLWQERFSIAQDALSSLNLIGLGLSLAISIGFGAACLLILLPALGELILPSFDSLRNVSAIALFPAFIVLMGLGWESKTTVILWTSLPAVLIVSWFAMSNVDKDVLDAARLDTDSSVSLLFFIRIPMAAATILSGLEVSVSGAWISLVASEMLGASQGLGHHVLVSSQTFQYPSMYAAIFTIAALGWLMSAIVRCFHFSIQEYLQ